MTNHVLRAVVVALVVAACSSSDADKASVENLSARLDEFDADLAETETQARSLSADWAEVTDAYRSITARYQDARRRHAEAKAHSSTASASLQQASADWEHAAASWRFYQEVLKLAVAMDRARARAGTASCERVSTAAFRRMLKARGIDLTGMDIDHIVPRALGGADHPMNYQVLDSSLNRSLGKRWDSAKCDMPGRSRCLEAITISAKCGEYRGGFF